MSNNNLLKSSTSPFISMYIIRPETTSCFTGTIKQLKDNRVP